MSVVPAFLETYSAYDACLPHVAEGPKASHQITIASSEMFHDLQDKRSNSVEHTMWEFTMRAR